MNAKQLTPHHGNLAQLMLDAAGYRKSHIVMTGIKFDVFTAIESLAQPSLFNIAAALKLAPRSVEKLLSGLLALELIERHEGSYRNSLTAKEYLLPSSPTFVGEAIVSLYEIGKSTWSHLSTVVEHGKPDSPQRTDEPNAKFWQNLTKAIRPFSLNVAEATAKLLTQRSGGVRTVLDLGGGSGVFGGAFLRHFPQARVYQVDWEAINEEARKFNQGFVDEQRFFTLDSDFYADDIWGNNGPFDIVVLSHIIHQESPERIVELLKKVKKHLAPDGSIIINEYYLNQQKNFPPYSLIFDLSMLLQNHGGGAYSFHEVAGWLASIDHEISLVTSPVPPSSVVISTARRTKLELAPAPVHVTAPRPAPELLMPRSFSERVWDYTPYAKLETLLAERLYQQLCYAAEHSVFWKTRLPKAIVTREGFSLAAFHALPLLSKDTLRLVPSDELTSSARKPYHLVRASSGTTGTPVPIYWSKGDWQAAVETSVRFLRDFTMWKGLRVYNGYHHVHVAGPAFDDILRTLLATPVPRHFNATDAHAIGEITREKVKALVLPPNAGTSKGGSLEDLLAVAPDFISRLGIQTILASSTDFSEELIAEVKELGVTNIINFYGTTEALPTAISCGEDPRSFHLAQGHIYLEVVDEHGKPVKSGERGQILVSRIGASLGDRIGPSEGTMLFRYRVGDSAIFHSEPCRCGITTPRISQLQRNPVEKDNFQGGCEKWE